MGASKKVENPIFAYSHLLPSPYTMPAGKAIFGTDVAFGITDSIQIGTSLIRDLYRSYNAQIKFELFDSKFFSFALIGSWEFYNLNSFSTSNPDLEVTIYSPGFVMGLPLARNLGWLIGASKNFVNVPLNFNGVSTSSFIRGTLVQSDLSWAYLDSKKDSGGNVLAVGTTYDLDYKIWGYGLSHYWQGFRIGFHYYPQADDQKLLPLITGSTVVNF